MDRSQVLELQRVLLGSIRAQNSRSQGFSSVAGGLEAGCLRISVTICSRWRRNAESVAADTSSTTVMVPCSAAWAGGEGRYLTIYLQQPGDAPVLGQRIRDVPSVRGNDLQLCSPVTSALMV